MVMVQAPVSPLVWASMILATTSRSTSLRFLRAASRRAALAIRSVSRMPPRGCLVDHGDCVGGKDLAIAGDAAKAHADVLGGVGRRQRVDT